MLKMPETRICEDLLDSIVVSDCVKGLQLLPDASTDLVIADPPYNLDKDFGSWKEAEHKAHWLAWCKQWLLECERIMKPNGNIFVYGIHRHLCWIQCYMYEIGLTYRRQIIWYYENGFSGYTKSLAAHYEPLLWFSKGKNYTYRPIREPYKSTERLKHKIIKNGRQWTPHPDGRLAGDVWRFPVLAGRRFAQEKVDHPTQKPLSISMRIVNHFSNSGEVVVVPFAGSGSECVAAYMSRRHFIGFELNPAYVKIARTRLRAVNKQPVLSSYPLENEDLQEA